MRNKRTRIIDWLQGCRMERGIVGTYFKDTFFNPISVHYLTAFKKAALIDLCHPFQLGRMASYLLKYTMMHGGLEGTDGNVRICLFRRLYYTKRVHVYLRQIAIKEMNAKIKFPLMFKIKTKKHEYTIPSISIIACWYALIHSSRLNHHMHIFYPRVDVI